MPPRKKTVRRVSFKAKHGKALRERVRSLKKQLAEATADYRSLYPRRRKK